MKLKKMFYKEIDRDITVSYTHLDIMEQKRDEKNRKMVFRKG